MGSCCCSSVSGPVLPSERYRPQQTIVEVVSPISSPISSISPASMINSSLSIVSPLSSSSSSSSSSLSIVSPSSSSSSSSSSSYDQLACTVSASPLSTETIIHVSRSSPPPSPPGSRDKYGEKRKYSIHNFHHTKIQKRKKDCVPSHLAVPQPTDYYYDTDNDNEILSPRHSSNRNNNSSSSDSSGNIKSIATAHKMRTYKSMSHHEKDCLVVEDMESTDPYHKTKNSKPSAWSASLPLPLPSNESTPSTFAGNLTAVSIVRPKTAPHKDFLP